MPLSYIPLWKEAPFIRLLLPFIAGIVAQWYLQLPPHWSWITISATSAGLLAFQAASPLLRFRLKFVTGALINLFIFSCATLITRYHHPAHTQTWLATNYTTSHQVRAVLQEPLSQKKNSLKSIAAATQLYHGGRITPVSGNIVTYFSQTVDPREISYGSIIIINKPLQPVKSSGNPGAFDYGRYSTFNHVGFQVYLQPEDFSIIGAGETRGLKKWIFDCREQVINIIHTYIKGRQESALAEALLIGYKDELDKDLVQAYSNTGVVHIIAVSGLHLGIIYWLLGLLARPLRKSSTKWIGFAIILAGLWAFSLLAGAGPSVMRSAFMFSLMVIGEAFSKRNTIYNNLAASAFLLLCWNPFWLWDAGFQLSYAAVLSIVLFFRPIYNLLYVRNKLLDAVWKLNAVTLSAQLLTIPISIYHFHQFPNYFIIANLVAVPLSTILLVGEIMLCALSFVPLLAEWTGTALNFLLGFLNTFIQKINALPFASWTHLQISIIQAMLLYGFIAAITWWLMQRNRQAFLAGLCMLTVFMAFRAQAFIHAAYQRRLIIYNVPKHLAMDFIDGRSYHFSGDAAVQSDRQLRNFHTEPSRTLHRISACPTLPALLGQQPLYSFHGKNILVINGNEFAQGATAIPADLLVLSKNPRIHLDGLLRSAGIRTVVAAGGNSARLISQWRQQCQAAGVPFHNVAEDGAFIRDF